MYQKPDLTAIMKPMAPSTRMKIPPMRDARNAYSGFCSESDIIPLLDSGIFNASYDL